MFNGILQIITSWKLEKLRILAGLGGIYWYVNYFFNKPFFSFYDAAIDA